MQGRPFRRFQEVKATVLGRRHDTIFTWSPANYMAFRPGGLSRRFKSSQPSDSAYSLGPYWRTMPLESRLVHDNGLRTLSAMLSALNFIFETTSESGAVQPREVAHLSMSEALQENANPATGTAFVPSYSKVMPKISANFPVRLELLQSSPEAISGGRSLTVIAGNIQMSLYLKPTLFRNIEDDPNYRDSHQQVSHTNRPSKPPSSSFTLPFSATTHRPLSLTTFPVVHAAVQSSRMITTPMRPRSAAFATSARQTAEGSPPMHESCQFSQEASPTRSIDLSQMANRRFIPLVLYVQRTSYLSPYIKIQSIVRHYREEEPSVFGVETSCIEEAVTVAVRFGLLTQVDEKRVKCVEGVSYCFRDVTNTSAAPPSKLSTHIPVIDMTWDVHRPYQPLLDYILLAMSIGPQMCIRTIVRHFQQEEPTIYGHEEQQIRIAISTAVQLGLLTQLKRERVKCVDGVMYKFEGDIVR